MKVTAYDVTPNSSQRLANASGLLSNYSIEFGDQCLIACEDGKWPQVSEEATERAISLNVDPTDLPDQHLHLVVQKGRLFQQSFPDAKVLLDKGRYLAVALDPAYAQKFTNSNQPCFTVRPLQPGETVFRRVERRLTGESRETDPATTILLKQISDESLKVKLNHLTSYHTRYSASREFQQAANWLAAELAGLGYTTRLEAVAMPGGQDRSLNVIAWREGAREQPRNLVIASAHLDSINHEGGREARAPGADDNASGCAALLEIARLFGSYPMANDLCLVFFGGEEQGLHGSKQFVRRLSREEKDRISAVVNMDMIGTKLTSPASVLIEAPRISAAVSAGLIAAAESFTSLRVETSEHYWGSDHVPFIESGIPAVLTIEGADQANENEHTARDTVDRLDLGILREITMMNAGFLVQALGRNETG